MSLGAYFPTVLNASQKYQLKVRLFDQVFFVSSSTLIIICLLYLLYTVHVHTYTVNSSFHPFSMHIVPSARYPWAGAYPSTHQASTTWTALQAIMGLTHIQYINRQPHSH